MLIWSGYGILVPFILIGGIVITSILEEFLSIFISFDGVNEVWKFILGTIISMGLPGLICIKMGQFLNNKQGKIYIDEETGEKILIKPKHTFFFIKMEKWGFVYMVLGILLIAILLFGEFIWECK